MEDLELEENEIIMILDRDGDLVIIPPEIDDITQEQNDILEQIVVSVKPSFFLYIVLRIEIAFVRLWATLFER
jgi:hypothetical protein